MVFLAHPSLRTITSMAFNVKEYHDRAVILKVLYLLISLLYIDNYKLCRYDKTIKTHSHLKGRGWIHIHRPSRCKPNCGPIPTVHLVKRLENLSKL